ncbi:Threonine/homoserine/homoserine lactone efflux protein [Cohaesibacter sp. ES.047]|uniref:LysE family translocator n=1 Tax=Cohaesibacter sp. ES.047 TaxID=1798205 RepID=UPI000BBFCEAA|nr:LysE family translocator [Cohaesibacter sp. ES.047]SNY92061.1 Threonine/homoserine/homoserine lactone efflux protein [Cohaesibacter sp. ES.047]
MIMSADSWGLFLFACLMLNIAPGPDLIFIMSRTIGHGRKVGIAASLGVCSGALVHVFAAALGLSAILATSAMAFSIVKYVGAAYLVWLGLKTLFSRQSSLALDEANDKQSVTPFAAYRQGVLVDIFNPKAALFFLAFLPQFIAHDIGRSSLVIFAETVFLGCVVILIAFAVEACFVLAAASLGRFLRNHNTLTQWIDRAFGGLLLGIGARIALSE